MIKKLCKRVFLKKDKPAKHEVAKQTGRTGKRADTSAKRISNQTHRIERRLLSNAAIETTEGLQKAGFEAYVVGGAVRDLLLKNALKISMLPRMQRRSRSTEFFVALGLLDVVLDLSM
jgi:poly(A) polymerase